MIQNFIDLPLILLVALTSGFIGWIGYAVGYEKGRNDLIRALASMDYEQANEYIIDIQENA